MKSVRDRLMEEHRRGASAKPLPTALPKVPTPGKNDNREWLHKFRLARYIGKDPETFDEDTHH
jgi:hypothetical protein